MEFDALMERRRSVRVYKPATIKEEELKALIDAALQAPTWKNSETGRYYVVTDPEMIAKIRFEMLPDHNTKKTENSVALIVTAFEKGIAGFGPEGPDNELGDEWGAYDLGLQNAYLVLKAADMGYDTLIMGLRDGDKLREALGIPESQEVAAVISLGVRVEDPKKPKRKDVTEVAKFFA